jgi:hypothetical protein
MDGWIVYFQCIFSTKQHINLVILKLPVHEIHHNSCTCSHQDSIQKQWSMFNSHSSGVWDATGNKLQLPSRKEIVDWMTTAYRSLQAAEQVYTSLHCSAENNIHLIYFYFVLLEGPQGSFNRCNVSHLLSALHILYHDPFPALKILPQPPQCCVLVLETRVLCCTWYIIGAGVAEFCVWLQSGWPGFELLQKQRIFPVASVSRPAPRNTQWVLGSLPQG